MALVPYGPVLALALVQDPEEILAQDKFSEVRLTLSNKLFLFKKISSNFYTEAPWLTCFS